MIRRAYILGLLAGFLVFPSILDAAPRVIARVVTGTEFNQPLPMYRSADGAVVEGPILPVPATTSCPVGAHCVVLSWVDSTTQASCVAPSCTWTGYNILRGAASRAESSTPINASPVSGPPYFDPLVLTSSAGTLFYEVQAADVSSGLAQTANSSETSVSFPALLQPATGVSLSVQ